MEKKRLLSAVMSLCMAAGAVSYGSPVITQADEAEEYGYYNAEATAVLDSSVAYSNGSCYSFDESTGTLTLKGDVMNGIRSLSYKDKVKTIKAEDGTILPDNCDSLFQGYSKCTSIDLSKADTSKVTDMSWMFCYCSSLESLDLSGFDTSNVKNMKGMFSYCYDLKSLDVSEFVTSNVSDMFGMFGYCTSLESLDLSGFDTINVTNMSFMFGGDSSLNSLNLSGFDTSNVTAMHDMFFRCYSLESLDLSGFDTSYVESMYNIFEDCNNLKTLILGNYFYKIPESAMLPNGNGWVNVKDSKNKISGDGSYAVIKNYGKNTYTQFTDDSLTYPTNIKVTYNKKNHQVKFTWDKVEGADRYGIAVYKSGKWRIQTQDITDTVYTSPKNLTAGKTYKVAIAARVNGEWDTENAIKNAVTVTIK